jgi:hypothetical protein
MSMRILPFGLSLCLFAVPASADILYSNGPLNGDRLGVTISPPFSVSDSFTVSNNANASGFDFVSWDYSGDSVVDIDWSIGTTAGAGDIASGTAALTSVLQFTNTDGFDVYVNSGALPNLTLGVGTYYLTFQNSVTANGRAAYWDDNDGPSFRNPERCQPI